MNLIQYAYRRLLFDFHMLLTELPLNRWLIDYFLFLFFFRAGDKHLDSSSDSEMDMPGMMMGNQGSKMGQHPNAVNASLSHNILLQQSQLGKLVWCSLKFNGQILNKFLIVCNFLAKKMKLAKKFCLNNQHPNWQVHLWNAIPCQKKLFLLYWHSIFFQSTFL